MKKSASGALRCPPLRLYARNALPARNAASYGRSRRLNSSGGSRSWDSSIVANLIETSAKINGLMANVDSSAARASALADHSDHSGSLVTRSRMTLLSTSVINVSLPGQGQDFVR